MSPKLRKLLILRAWVLSKKRMSVFCKLESSREKLGGKQGTYVYKNTLGLQYAKSVLMSLGGIITNSMEASFYDLLPMQYRKLTLKLRQLLDKRVLGGKAGVVLCCYITPESEVTELFKHSNCTVCSPLNPIKYPCERLIAS